MTETAQSAPQHLLRELSPQVLGRLVRRYGDFSACEDALQEALLAAAQQWPREGLPESPLGWLIRVASRRLTDQVRSDAARRHREQLVVSLVPADEQLALLPDDPGDDRDDTLELFFTCCHSALSTTSQVALTLRALGGLTTAEIARAFVVPEATMAQRISRAKRTIRESGGNFPKPDVTQRQSRLQSVLSVLYLIFNEGYAATAGKAVHRVDLSDEAIRVTRLLVQAAPTEPEANGLLALLLLTDARRHARCGPHGELIPLDQQDRSLWDRERIEVGTRLLEQTLRLGRPGPFQVQAAIAALHDEASSTETTDWPQILALYAVLVELTDNPMARLNHAVALAMVRGASQGLAALDELAEDPRLAEHHRLAAARAHLFERLGRHAEAIDAYELAASQTSSLAERDYLWVKAAQLAEAAQRGARGTGHTP